MPGRASRLQLVWTCFGLLWTCFELGTPSSSAGLRGSRLAAGGWRPRCAQPPLLLKIEYRKLDYIEWTGRAARGGSRGPDPEEGWGGSQGRGLSASAGARGWGARPPAPLPRPG